ncbi:hypothetical protein [Aphanizomenon flos-aquae]|uniref:hypothetical protein n=1 Tax=Aphanizomenon flos-aquae TaxID=1176 RepID=UPI000ABFBC0F|nr:hypothetical protein [Aphanizomenon flos-aquae]
MFSHCTTAFYITGYSDRIPTSKKAIAVPHPKKRTACSSASLSPSHVLNKRSLISQDDNYQITEHS